MNSALVKYVLKAAIRDRLIISMLVVLAVCSCLSIFLGSAATIEKDQFTLVFAAGGIRIVSVFGLVLFSIFFVRRSFDSKDIEFLLSRPVGRIQFILSYAFALSIIAIIMTVMVGIALISVAPHLFGIGHLLWILSVGVESIIMINTALFFSMYISSAATASMAAFGFYVLGRMMGQLLGIVDSDIANSEILAFVLQLVSVVTPRLDLIGQTSWLLYGPGDGYGFIFATLQGVVFLILILSATILDFLKRQF